MGIFLKITSESQGAETVEKAIVNNNVINYILDGLNDYYWQDQIASKLRTLNPQYSHITLGTILRLFLPKNIEVGNLKSFSRYIKKDDKVVIDQMLATNKYESLTEDETRKMICDDVLSYFEEVILKNKTKFQDFDAVSFVPLLKERFEEIKARKIVNGRKQIEE